MSARHVDFLLIGGGIASASCARTLRQEGADGSVMVVGRELDAPYHRPPISKGLLAGTSARDDAAVLPPEWWAENDVELHTRASVMSLDLGERVATLQSKESLHFGAALVATGALVRRLTVDGAGLEGVHYLRTPANADSLRGDLGEAARVVCVGGSYIGCEVAATLSALGHRCTIVMQEATTLERGFGSRVGRWVEERLRERGVEVVGGEEVERFEGADDRVTGVVTRSGRRLHADAVVAGVGALPDVMLARRAGLALGDSGGVSTSATLEASAPGVFAAGDMCEYDSVLHGGAVRIEHEDVARAHGVTAARGMLGRPQKHSEVPYFFSDLSDWLSLEHVGAARRWDQEVVRGTMDGGSFAVFYLDEGRVVAALSVGRPDELAHARRLIAAGVRLETGELTALADRDRELAPLAGHPEPTFARSSTPKP